MLTIELSTVAFFRGDPPTEIALRDCSLPMVNPPAKAFSALFGLQGKQDGFVAARSYAASHGFSYTVVDLLVGLEAQNPQVMKPDDLPKYDFLNFSRVSRLLGQELAARIAGSRSEMHLDSSIDQALRVQPLRNVFARWPALLDRLLELPECRHLKVVASQVETALSPRPIGIGSVPHHWWSCIQEATCRLNPNIFVSIEAPE